ncbi:MAG: ribonuclease domain-containing protein [Erysipelotrichaceae bacterium]|nr:ribonuclease domain-containing protein [Erysipelotrichaceae bacterium]
MKNRSLKFILLIILTALLFIGVSSFLSTKSDPQSDNIPVTVTEPENSNTTTEPVIDNNTVTDNTTSDPVSEPVTDTFEVNVTEDGTYTSKEEVAAYIIKFHKLPSNYITKTKAKKLGWDSSKGNLQDVCKGCSIGGGPFTNLEGNLPEGDYYECDIDYEGGYRNAKRLVYTHWGTIYYTEDHYATFELIYDENN